MTSPEFPDLVAVLQHNNATSLSGGNSEFSVTHCHSSWLGNWPSPRHYSAKTVEFCDMH